MFQQKKENFGNEPNEKYFPEKIPRYGKKCT